VIELDECGWCIYRLFQKARDSALPEDFEGWSQADETGWTVAHEAVYLGTLPKGHKGAAFWKLKTHRGETVWRVHMNRLALTRALSRDRGE
jgi:hypothetical protein